MSKYSYDSNEAVFFIKFTCVMARVLLLKIYINGSTLQSPSLLLKLSSVVAGILQYLFNIE